MVKAILIGSQQCQWDINGHMTPGGTVVELSEADIEKHKDVVFKVVDIKESAKPVPVEEPKPFTVEPPKPATGKYTKEDLNSIASKEGIAGLRTIGDKLGLKFTSINKGIKAILEAQK